MKKIAIYTAMIGEYDDIYQPEMIDEQYDYYLFSDNVVEKKVGVWNVRHVKYINKDKTRIARYVKTHPHELLSEYEATIWIDANVDIISKELYRRGINLLTENVDIAGIKHPLRDCIYDEAFLVLANGLEFETIIYKWCHYLRNSQYPKNNGLYESNVLFRRNNDVVIKANSLWWHFIEEYSRRDQLSLNYVLNRLDIKNEYIFGENEHCRNSKNISVRNHNSCSTNSGRRSLPTTKFEYLKNRIRAGFIFGENHHKNIHFWIWKQSETTAKVLLLLWGIYAILFWSLIARYNSHKNI